MTNPAIGTINVVELNELLKQNPKLCLIDVREQEEWDEGHIAKAMHIPKGKVAEVVDQLIDKSTPLYLHCKGGTRSMLAAQTLFQMGYQQVYSVQGGIGDWIRHGYPVVK